jgi:hypothetical protein
MNDIISILKHYKITVSVSTLLEDIAYVERYGITIVYNNSDLYNRTPNVVAREIINKFVNHPDYKEATTNYVKGLTKKPIPVELSIKEKKKLIREKLKI